MAIVLTSGGLDSTVLAAKVMSQESDVVALFFDFGQDAKNMELAVLHKFARSRKLCVQLGSLPGIQDLFRGLAGIPHSFGHVYRADPNPYGNFECRDEMIVLAIAAEYAVLNGHGDLYVGLTKEDQEAAPGLKSFVKHMSKATNAIYKGESKSKPLKIKAPFIDKTKAEIVKMGKRLKVPLELTWSCRRNGYEHCNKCAGCELRSAAFASAKIVDPLATS